MTIEVGHATRVVYLLQASSGVERRLLRHWIQRSHPASSGPPEIVELGGGDSTKAAQAALVPIVGEIGDHVLLQPMSVAWTPRLRGERRDAKLRDVLLEGDPRRPRRFQHALLLRADPNRAQVVVAEPATTAHLADRYAERGGTGDDSSGFAAFVARRATLALDREETRLHGPQYKIPRLVRDEVWNQQRFQAGLRALADELGRPPAAVERDAAACLDEMVAGYGRSRLDISMALGRSIRRQGYDPDLDIDETQAQAMAARVRGTSAVVLPTHRSNFDASVMPTAWHHVGLPPTHTIAGINMAFWPMGPIMRHAGAIFIRRDTKGDSVYRFVLREYIGYLTEKRFPLEWYIEGGRSRTGKLLPPKMGLLKYVVDAYREGRTTDVMLVPASMTYDQLREIADYASEARGQVKKKEGMGWALGYLRTQHRSYGKIYVRFGEPVSLRETIGPPGGEEHEDNSIVLQKLGFEVATRINQVTPISASALVTLALLGGLGRALTFDQVVAVVRTHLADATRRALPMTTSATALQHDDGIRAALQSLVDNGVVVRWDRGVEPIFAVDPDQHLAASFYRNSIIHHFLDESICQVAVAAAGRAGGSPTEVFWSTALRLRDLLKFDFFFRDKQAFRAGITAELARQDAGWETVLATGSPVDLLARMHPLTAHLTLRTFVEAYTVVAAELRHLDDEPVTDRAATLRRCVGLGRQLLLQQRLRSPESVSKPLFETGLQLADNAGLLIAGSELARRRAEFEAELRTVLSYLDDVQAVAAISVADLLKTDLTSTSTAGEP